MRASQLIVLLSVAFVGGIFVRSQLLISQQLLLIVFIVGIFSLTVFSKYKVFVVCSLMLFAVFLGIWRYEVEESERTSLQLVHSMIAGREVFFEGRVVADPDVRIKNVQIVVQPQDIAGNILVTTDKYQDVQYGDVLHITGKLQEPEVFSGFNYKDFLSYKGIYSVMYSPNIELKERGNYGTGFSTIKAHLFNLKHTLRETLHSTIAPPESSILGAVLLGDKSRLPQGIKEKLNLTGTRHITAISGMHVAILIILLMNMFLTVGLWRSQALYFTIGLMIVFILFTGAAPSAIRAGIMGGSYLIAQQIGRINVSLRVLVFAATFMLLFNPFLLAKDIGFQLSFLAVFGIISFTPFLNRVFAKVPNPWHLRDVLCMTIAAQTFTLPILIYNFGQVSLVSMFTNILIVPILPFVIASGFVFLVVGTVFPFLSFLSSLPVSVLLHYMTAIIDFFSELPFAVLVIQNLNPLWLLLLYLLLGFILWKFRKQQEFPYSTN
ncbi:ComEC/Rec2 family competence protein [Patescibacteria group bacterium]|nr:ComEC/Rec2 family competence protein [Patescibacteria group bacterium]